MLMQQSQSPMQQMQQLCLQQQVQAQMQAGIRIRAKASLFSKSKHPQPRTVHHQALSRPAQLSRHRSLKQQVLPIVVMVYKVSSCKVVQRQGVSVIKTTALFAAPQFLKLCQFQCESVSLVLRYQLHNPFRWTTPKSGQKKDSHASS